MQSTEVKCAIVSVQCAFIGSCRLFAKNAGADRGGDEHQPHERCRCGSDEAIEVVPVVHDRRPIGCILRAVHGTQLRFEQGRRGSPSALHSTSCQRHHPGNCDGEPTSDQNQSA